MNALRPVILAIEADFFVLPRRQPEHLQREKLQRSQQFAPAVEQQGGIRSGEINQNFRLLPIAVFRNRRVDHDPILEPEPAVRDHGLQKLVNLFGSSDFIGNGHE